MHVAHAADSAAPVARPGFYHRGLSERMRESLVEMARIGAEGARQEGREAMHQHGAHKLQSRQERLQLALDLAVEKYAHAKELFAAWQSQRAESIAEVDAYIHERPEAQKLEFLRKQIEMRVLGCGMTQFSTQWSSSSDVRIGTVEHLRDVLDEIIMEERALKRLKKLGGQRERLVKLLRQKNEPPLPRRLIKVGIRIPCPEQRAGGEHLLCPHSSDLRRRPQMARYGSAHT